MPGANGGEAIVFGREPGAKRTGVVPVTAEICAIINEALSGRSDAHLNDRPIFDVPIETFERWFEKAVVDAGITNLRFHDLRHEATSRLFEAGLSTVEVMSITGHTTTEMVERYSHYSAVLVLEKLERSKRDPESILQDIEFMVTKYRSLAGDEGTLSSCLRRLIN